MCHVLGASRSGYYDWISRDPNAKQKKITELKAAIQEAFNRSRGSPRIYHDLKNNGYDISEEAVAKLMQEMGIRAKTKRKFKVCTTESKHTFPIAKNELNQEFKSSRLGEFLLGDITYIPTNEGWLYLAGVLDLCSRRLIGWAMGDRIDRQLTIDALHMALRRQKPAPDAIFHSDRGSQYACYEYQGLLVGYGFTPSMSRSGNCYDNSPMESFFHTLKTEFIHHVDFETRDEAKLRIFEWIEAFYNRLRLHSSLGYKTPVAYAEEKMLVVA